jgi:hypothetical protein
MTKRYQKDRRAHTGAANELLVASDLIKKGYDIFRSESPHAPFDLVAHKDGVLLRIEVRTGQRLANGKTSVGRFGHWDVLAIVVSGRIEYEGRAI